MEIIDRDEMFKLDFYSKSKRVDVTQEFIDELTEACELQYKLNA